jgi:hypothetical protein
MWPTAALNAKPAPLHAGDFDAVGYSTVLQTSTGWGMLQDGSSGQAGAAARRSNPMALTEGGLRSPLVAIAVVVAALLYLDHRIAR